MTQPLIIAVKCLFCFCSGYALYWKENVRKALLSIRAEMLLFQQTSQNAKLNPNMIWPMRSSVCLPPITYIIFVLNFLCLFLLTFFWCKLYLIMALISSNLHWKRLFICFYLFEFPYTLYIQRTCNTILQVHFLYLIIM